MLKEEKMVNPIVPSLEGELFQERLGQNASTFTSHKNRLQEYTQRSLIPLPVYHTINEGALHAPQFRSTVTVDEHLFTSVNTYSHIKTAEQEAAKIALEFISKKIKEEGCPFIHEAMVLSKSILNEFAVKMKLDMPIYNTCKFEGMLPLFVSSVTFNGMVYNGKTGKNKKEAEQLAARAVLLSLLDDSRYATFLTEIIRGKSKHFVSINRGNDASTSQPNSGAKRPHHEFNISNLGGDLEHIDLPITFVPPNCGQSSGVSENTSNKRSKKKKKKAKLNPETQLAVACVSSDQTTPCAVAP